MSDLNTLVSQGNAVNLVAAACLTLLVYDHAITLHQEIDKMWPTRLSCAKILFFMNRYPVEAMLLFNCISASRPYQSENFVVQGILVLRVWALHRHNKLAVFIAFLFYFGGIAVLVALVIKDYVGETVKINTDLASLPGCYATSVPSIIAGFWIGPLVVETVLFFLVASRAYTWWKDGMALPNIFILLARDSTLYYLIVFSFLLSNFLVFQLGPPFLSSLLVTPSTTAGCILGSHMILNLRTAVRADSEDSADFYTKSLQWSAGPNPVIDTTESHARAMQLETVVTGRPKRMGSSFEYTTPVEASPSRWSHNDPSPTRSKDFALQMHCQIKVVGRSPAVQENYDYELR